MTQRSGTSLVEYFTDQSYIHTTIASPCPRLLLWPGRRPDALTADHSTLHLPPLGREGPLPRYHPAPSRNEVAIVQPVLVEQLENDMLTAIAFLPRWLLTGTKVGHVKLWIRPLPMLRKNGHTSRGATDVQDLDWVS